MPTEYQTDEKGVGSKSRSNFISSAIEPITDALTNMPLHRLVFIMLLLAYSTTAWSKKENGITSSDIAILIVFTTYLMLISTLTVVLKNLYNTANQSDENLFVAILKSKKRLQLATLSLLLLIYIISTHWGYLYSLATKVIEKLIIISFK